MQGRWSSARRIVRRRAGRRALAELLLERQGIVTRDGVRGEGIPGGFGAVYAELRALETIGVCRRGYFVEGLGEPSLLRLGPSSGSASSATARATRSSWRQRGRLSPTAQRCRGRSGRPPVPPAWRAQVVLLDGEAALFVERGGRSLLPLRDPDESWLRDALDALVSFVRAGGAKRLAVERFDGEPVVESVAPLLVESGFLVGPRRAVLRP